MTVHAIVADHYREEHALLITDLIVIELALGLPANFPVQDFGSWEFIQSANHEYKLRGGDGATSIGGVAKAIHTVWYAHYHGHERGGHA